MVFNLRYCVYCHIQMFVCDIELEKKLCGLKYHSANLEIIELCLNLQKIALQIENENCDKVGSTIHVL